MERFLEAIWHLAMTNKMATVILLSAFVVTMPLTLPRPFNRIDVFNWLWTWLRTGLGTFLNMRGGGTAPPGNPPAKP